MSLIIRHALWLIQFNLTIKKESRKKTESRKLKRKKMNLEKNLTEFGGGAHLRWDVHFSVDRYTH